MFVILRGAHARFERGGRPASADDTCCSSASAEILRGSCAADWGRRLRPLRLDRALCALRAHSSAHFFAALRGSNPASFVARQSRRVAALASAADAGRIVRAKAWPARRSPSEHCRRQRLRVLLAVRGFLRIGGRSPASAGKRLSRRCSGDFMASPFCRGKLPGFSCVSGRMAETQAAGKALSPARSRKRAECGRPGLPHSG